MEKLLWNIIIPLLVTFAGGVGIYYYTRPSEAPADEFSYTSSNLSQFEIDGSKYINSRIDIDNSLDEKVENVLIEVTSSGLIKDVLVDATLAGVPLEVTVSDSNGGKSVLLGDLKGGAEVSVNFLIRSEDSLLDTTSEAQGVRFLVTSDDRVAKEGLQIGQDSIGLAKKIQIYLWAFWPIIALAALYIPLRRQIRHLYRSKNDTAFTLLHTGSPLATRTILQRSIEQSGASVYELSNYAGTLAMCGEIADANSYIRAAAFLSGSKGHWIVTLNRAIIEVASDNAPVAKKYLEEFKAARPSSYREYKKFSNIIAQIESDQTALITHPSSTPR